jgi:tetratricopeptide (TPR) repeat protein
MKTRIAQPARPATPMCALTIQIHTRAQKRWAYACFGPRVEAASSRALALERRAALVLEGDTSSDWRDRATHWIIVGESAYSHDRFDDACRYYAQATAVYETAGKPSARKTIEARLALVDCLRRIGRASEACDPAVVNYEYARATASQGGLLLTLTAASLGQVYIAIARFDDARRLLEEARLAAHQAGLTAFEKEFQGYIDSIPSDKALAGC